MKTPILFENDDVVVLDKPFGLTVHAGSGATLEETLAGEVLAEYPALPVSNGVERPGVVHRLDKDTSGIILFAKTEGALAFYIDQWKKRKVTKAYYALVSGILEPKSGTIEAPVARDIRNRQRMSSAMNKGKMAITHYEVVEYFRTRAFPTTLVKVKIETGRTHQIRVHFSAIGFPVVGDALYGRGPINTFFRETFGLTRQFLHAASLTFGLMGSRKKQAVVSKIPSDLQKVLDDLKAILDESKAK